MKIRLFRSLAAVVIAATFLGGVTLARADGITSEQAQQILDELKAIRKSLDARPVAPAQAQAPAPVSDKVDMAFPAGGFSVGKDSAPLVLVEYTDYQCPFCQRYHNDAFAQIKTNFIDTGKVRYISRDYPLPFHENARRSATAARCAAEQGKFWELRHTMIVNANQLQADKLGGYAQSVSLDVPKFQACVDSDKYRAAIDKDIAEGTAAGVSGTPSFVLGRIENGKLQGVRIVGAAPYPQFEAKIQDMLKTVKN
ncbi:MAG: DsbA family protein [Pseudomonadota bacterium]|nr:DsbA family protein [Pseudomonadota bacterium]